MNISTVIAGSALVVSIVVAIVAILTLRRNCNNDVKTESTEITTVIVKLENIATGVNELKTELRDIKADLKEHGEKLVKFEQQIKALNKAVFKNENQ